MNTLIGLFIGIFAGIFLFLIALFFSRTKISGEASRTESKLNARVLIKFLRNLLSVRFDFFDNRKQIGFFLGSWKIYQKDLTPKTPGKAKTKTRPPKKKKRSLQSRLLVLKKNWQPGRRTLKKLLVQFKFSNLEGVVHVGLGSPFTTGLFYGYWLAVREVIPLSSLTIYPEFLNKEISGWITTDVQFRLIGLVKTAVPFWLKIRKIK
ncbi:MAG: hypothetical protein GXO76_15430 [Calditrichaeota bacterium]|nr:hypothetical protein [Calditrichota bacterium]